MKCEYHKYLTVNGFVEWWGYYHDIKFYHRENGPAYISYGKNGNKLKEIYVVNGMWHRTDGPAYIAYDRHGEIESASYFVLDKIIVHKDFKTPGFIDAFLLEHS